MSIVKYAKSDPLILAMGSLKDLVEDKTTPDTVLKKVASYLPIANHLDDFIYIRHRAISAFEHYGANGNHDAFPQAELMKAYATFTNTGFFKDHNNDDSKKAYGLNLDAYYHPKHFVVLLTAVSRKMQGPNSEEMVKNILANKWNQTSMGAAVGYSECSLCHNKATDPAEYCEHIRHAKGMVVDGHRIVEINYDLQFFEDSCITTEAADKDARMAEVFLPEELEAPTISAEVLAGDFTKHIRTPHIKYRKQAARDTGTNVSTVVPDTLNTSEGGKSMSKPVVADAKRPNEVTVDQNVAPTDQAALTDISDLSRSKQTVDSSGTEKSSPTAVAAPEQISQLSDAGQDYGQSVKAKKAEAKTMPKNKLDYKKNKKAKNKKSKKSGGVIRQFFGALSNILGEDEAAMPDLDLEMGGAEEGEEEGGELETTIQLVNETQDAVNDQKQQLLSKMRHAVLASSQRRIQADLDELQQSETALVEVKHDLEDMLNQENEGDEVSPDAVEKAVEEATEVVNQALNQTDGAEEGESAAAEEDGDEAATEEIAEKVSSLRKRANKVVTAEEGDEMPGSPAAKAERGNPQALPPSKDYDLADWAAYKSVIDGQDSKTRSQIDSQRDTGFANKEERMSMGDRLKTARRATGSRKIRMYADETATMEAPQAPSSEDLAKQIIEMSSDKIVEQIFQSNPAGPAAAAGADQVGAPPQASAEELFGTPPKQASRRTRANVSFEEGRGSIGSDETPESKLPTSDDPSDDSNDLFPEDSITRASGEANREQQSQLTQDLKGVFVPTAPGKQIDPKGIYPKASVSLEQKISEALNLAQQLVDAGLAQEADLESESKRLFRMSPEKLKGVAAVLKTAASKKGFPHPDEGLGLVTSAIHFGSGGVFGEGQRDEAVLFDDDMALF